MCVCRKLVIFEHFEDIAIIMNTDETIEILFCFMALAYLMNIKLSGSLIFLTEEKEFISEISKKSTPPIKIFYLYLPTYKGLSSKENQTPHFFYMKNTP